ncbi:VOC family protein [Streptomyces sp. NPDC093586]|uniref:VOC family protein n=1 Tax=Streptomyces sp. NPDC093586 TaxID=3366042 RepID=UPI003816DBAB
MRVVSWSPPRTERLRPASVAVLAASSRQAPSRERVLTACDPIGPPDALECPRAGGLLAGCRPPCRPSGCPGGKAVENRLHFDVSPIDGSTDDEVTGLLGLGGTRTDVGQGPDRSWVVMSDPGGSEFCVLRTLASDG